MQILNKKANFEYFLEPERYEAGIALTGAEAQAIRLNHADISAASVRILDGEIYLINAKVFNQNTPVFDPVRTRKLLMHRAELTSLDSKSKGKKLTFVPIGLYTKGHLIKLMFALGKLKRKFEKKEALKKKELTKALKEVY